MDCRRLARGRGLTLVVVGEAGDHQARVEAAAGRGRGRASAQPAGGHAGVQASRAAAPGPSRSGTQAHL